MDGGNASNHLNANRKVISRERCTEGSRTAKVGTDVQKPNKRLYSSGQVAHHTDALNEIPDVVGNSSNYIVD